MLCVEFCGISELFNTKYSQNSEQCMARFKEFEKISLVALFANKLNIDLKNIEGKKAKMIKIYYFSYV